MSLPWSVKGLVRSSTGVADMRNAGNASDEEGVVRDEAVESRQRQSLHWSVH